MTPHTKLLAYCITGAVGFVFGIVVFFARRQSPVWARYSFLTFGLLALSYGVLGYILERYRASLSFHSRVFLDHYITLVAGIEIGVFAVLIVSGQLKLLLKSRNEV